MSPLEMIPCPRWLSNKIDAHFRLRMLVLEIWMLSDRTTAFLALWLSRAATIRGGTVEGSLRAIKANLMRGGGL